LDVVEALKLYGISQGKFAEVNIISFQKTVFREPLSVLLVNLLHWISDLKLGCQKEIVYA
jgi:hypothetical protein